MCNFSIELLEEADAPFGAETQDVADAKFPRRPGEGFPGRAVDALVQHRLDHGLGLAATEPAALEPGGNDLRVVDDEAVPRPQEFGQVAHAAILKFGLPAGPYHEKPGRVARLHPATEQASPMRAARRGHRAAMAPVPVLAHAPIDALTIRSGSTTGSPRLMASTFSMPAMTLPQTVYFPSRKRASSKQMKNWLSAESGSAARAIDTVPRTCGSRLNSALSLRPEPPVPVPKGQPACAMKPSMTR